MKIAVFGILPFSDLIKQGFIKLNHTVTNNEPDLIYSNDPTGYQDAIFLKQKHPNVRLILNILDIPWHFPNIKNQTINLVNRFLNKADIITTISFKVKKDIAQFLSETKNKKVKVIYNPTKDVYLNKDTKKENEFLFVGRANDPIKRFQLIKQCLEKTSNGEKNIKICGQEDPNFGNFLGYVSDKELNKLYNSSKFVLLPSKAEGIGLPMIEAMICGSIPVACSDNETAKEFLPKDFICEPNVKSILLHINKLKQEYNSKRELAIKIGDKYKEQFNKVSVAQNILSTKI